MEDRIMYALMAAEDRARLTRPDRGREWGRLHQAPDFAGPQRTARIHWLPGRPERLAR